MNKFLPQNNISGLLKKNKLYDPFLWMGSTASRLEQLRGGGLLSITKFPDVPGTYFTDLGRMKGWLTLEPLSGFEHGTPGLGIQHLNH